MDRETNRKGTKLMGEFLGWPTYDIKWRCEHCGEEHDPEDFIYHEHCEAEAENEDNDRDEH